MKIKCEILIIILILFIVESCNNSINNNDQTGTVEIININSEELEKLKNSNDIIILDVRTIQEIEQGYINGASFIDYYDDDFLSKINFIQKNKPIVVYCKMGGRSSASAELLVQNGFKEVYNLSGGISSWQESGFDLIQLNISSENKEVEFSSDELNELLDDSKPLFISFKTKWCLPCKKITPILDELSNTYHDQINYIDIDIDANKLLAKKYNIKSVPTLVAVVNNSEVWRNVGFVDKDFLIQTFNEILLD